MFHNSYASQRMGDLASISYGGKREGIRQFASTLLEQIRNEARNKKHFCDEYGEPALGNARQQESRGVFTLGGSIRILLH